YLFGACHAILCTQQGESRDLKRRKENQALRNRQRNSCRRRDGRRFKYRPSRLRSCALIAFIPGERNIGVPIHPCRHRPAAFSSPAENRWVVVCSSSSL